MRTAVLWVLLSAAPALAAPPAPSDAVPGDFVPAAAVPAAQAAPQAVPAPAPQPDMNFADANVKRTWLRARLAAGLRGDAARLRIVDQDLAVMTDAQLDRLIEVYRQRQQQLSAAGPDELAAAQQNLAALQAQRDALAQQLNYRIAMQQVQYLNFRGPSGYSPGYNLGPFGYTAGYYGPYAPGVAPFGFANGAFGPYGGGYAVPPYAGGYAIPPYAGGYGPGPGIGIGVSAGFGGGY